MPSCAFRKCSNNSRNSNKDTGVTFHVFPQETYLKEKWIKIIQFEQKDDEWLPTKYSRICSAHFSDDMFYMTPTGRRKIKKNAVPSLWISCLEPKIEILDSPLHDVYVSDNESIFDSPRKISLKRQLKTEISKKIKYRSELQKEKRKTRRLKLINAKLKETIKKLRGKKIKAKEHREEVKIRAEEPEK